MISAPGTEDRVSTFVNLGDFGIKDIPSCNRIRRVFAPRLWGVTGYPKYPSSAIRMATVAIISAGGVAKHHTLVNGSLLRKVSFTFGDITYGSFSSDDISLG